MIKKDLPTRNPSDIGYTMVYESLIDKLTNRRSWWALILFFYANASMGLVLFLTASTYYIKTINEFDVVIRALLFLLWATLTYGIAFGSFVGIITGLSNNHVRLNELIARLLISVPHPYKRKCGLNIKELEQISEIAKIEQGSADWRASFVSVAVLSVIIGILGWAENEMGLSMRFPRLETLFSDPGEIGVILLWAFCWIILVLFALNFSKQLAEYVSAFLGRERANRTILLACREAQSLLSSLGLAEKDILSIKEKISLESHLFCKIVPERERHNYTCKSFFVLEDEKKSVWFLLFSAAEKKKKPLRVSWQLWQRFYKLVSGLQKHHPMRRKKKRFDHDVQR